jgi:hypothetical protein
MYFTVDDLDGSYGTDRAIRLAAEGVHFTRFDGREVPLPLELVSIGEMLEATDDEYKRCASSTRSRKGING